MDSKIFLMPLRRQDIPEFKKNMQESFSVTVTEVFGAPENGPIPSDADIDGSLCDKNAHAFRIFCDEKETGGAIVLFDKASRRASLDLFSSSATVSARGSDTAHGKPSNVLSRRQKFGNSIPLVLKNGISIFMSINAVFIS